MKTILKLLLMTCCFIQTVNAVELLNVRVTSYRAIKEQTDDTPNWTSIGHHVHSFGAAVSPDMLKTGEVCYGDAVSIPGIGIRVVNDTTHPRLKRTIDVFVDSKAEEQQIGIRHPKVQHIRSDRRFCSRSAFLEAQKNHRRYK